MVLNWFNTIAYKCPACGAIEFHNISLFDFSGKKEYTVPCMCGASLVKLITRDNGLCNILIPCIACNTVHTYTINFKDLWTKRIMCFKCTKTKIELCFIGCDDAVRKAVDLYEIEMDKLMEDIGYDNGFANSVVMLHTVDRIHDIAEKNDLLCQCGNYDINLRILYDSVELTCNKCFACETIKACTNQDLKLTLKRDSIIISDDIRKKYLKL